MSREPIDHLLRPFSHFLRHELASGALLLLATLAAVILANSSWGSTYEHLWHIPLGIDLGTYRLERSLHHWINDGLMAIFFFVVGLELKREMIGGELRDRRKVLLPVAAGLGGMLFPALIFLAFNGIGTETTRGWGIPMGTDIAFALGLMALLGDRVPLALKVFLTTVAIADDIGSVLVIALFYTSDISFVHLGIAAGGLIIMMFANRMGVRSTMFYGIVGVGLLWSTFLLSGVHATIAGVLAAFTIPARVKVSESVFLGRMRKLLDRFAQQDPNNLPTLTEEQLHTLSQMKGTSADAETPLQRIEHGLHPWVAFVILPLFAFANAGVLLPDLSALGGPVFPGVALGLLIGKPVGILLTCWLMLKLKWAALGEGIRWPHLVGMSILAGVGFTMSLFVAELAFVGTDALAMAKAGVLAASVVAGTLGLLLLRRVPG